MIEPFELRHRGWPVRIWSWYKFCRQNGGRLWALRTAIKNAFIVR